MNGGILPITSYGIVLYKRDEKGKIYFYIQQNRNTFEYVDFIRGLWKTKEDLIVMFSLMTKEERDMIKNYTFDELWDDLFIYPRYVKNRDRAKEKYLNSKKYIAPILYATEQYIDVNRTPSWGFPKGKKNYNESDKTSALRETEEETRINRRFIRLKNKTFYEEFYGTDGIKYATVYFLGEIPNTSISNPSYKCLGNIRKKTLSEEVCEYRWLNIFDAMKLLNNNRREILKEAFVNIKRIYNQNIKNI